MTRKAIRTLRNGLAMVAGGVGAAVRAVATGGGAVGRTVVVRMVAVAMLMATTLTIVMDPVARAVVLAETLDAVSAETKEVVAAEAADGGLVSSSGGESASVPDRCPPNDTVKRGNSWVTGRKFSGTCLKVTLPLPFGASITCWLCHCAYIGTDRNGRTWSWNKNLNECSFDFPIGIEP